MIVAVVFGHIEIDRAVADVGIAGVDNRLDILDLLDDVARRMWLNRGRKHVEALHGGVVAVEIILHHFHRLKLLYAGFFRYLVLALVGVMLEMAHVGDVAHIAHLVAEMSQIAEHHVERDGRTGMSEMAVAIDRRAADIHAHAPLMDRTEQLFAAGKRIIDCQIVGFHNPRICKQILCFVRHCRP